MKFFRLLCTAIMAALFAPVALLSSCDDNTSEIGSSLVTDKSEIVVDTTFTIVGRSLTNDVMSARTLTQLIGAIDADGYGRLSSDYVTQMMPSASIDTTGTKVEDIDSICLILRFYGNKITGDSLVPMGLKAFALERQLPADIDSRFKPEGYYDPSAPLAQAIYTSNNIYDDSLAITGTHVISAKLPLELGKYLYDLYLKNPEVYQSPISFAEKFPGLYIANSFGSGRVTNIYNTRLALYYSSHQKYTDEKTKEERDTVLYRAGILAASTPEVLTNNNLSFSIAPQLLDSVAAGVPMIVAPLGLDVEFTMPTREILSSFNNDIQSGTMGVINSLSMMIPAEKITNEYGINPPSQVLLVLADKKKQFFDENKVPDNITSFLATYSESLGGYYITGMRPYIMQFANKPLSEITDSDCRFILTPVDSEVETVPQGYYGNSYEIVTAIGPYIDGPAMAKISLDKAKITFTYSTETIKF